MRKLELSFPGAKSQENDGPLTECFHVFCRACILRYFENNKTGCPTCNTIYKKKSQACFRSDPQTQSLVYKLVPFLFSKEIQRREDFYRSTGVRASSSCSDDSVIDRERDMMNDQEEMISNCVGDKAQFLSPDDSISLSLEYYQVHLDTSDSEKKPTNTLNNNESEIKNTEISETSDKTQTGVAKDDTEKSSSECVKDNALVDSDKDSTVTSEKQTSRECDKRFLQCPAAVSMKHLQKFIRMKFGLTSDHRVDIIYKGEVLSQDFSLMDVAYTFKWKKIKPMRFFYRIFTPLKIRPIKIVNTTVLGGGKQLQIVPVKSTTDSQMPPPLSPKEVGVEKNKEEEKVYEETEDQKNHKERLFAHLQLQSKSQVEKDTKKVPEKSHKDCVFEYEEPDEEEIKKFAEKRDREWALQKKLDESKRKDEEYVMHHISKKRKKSKHSKSEFNVYKKRKLHAEIASNEEDLKLKVKITNNGHKHKHHKSSAQADSGKSYSSDGSSKEKLLQMRQVRHKHLSSEDKNIQTVPSIKLSKDSSTTTDKISTDVDKKPVKENGESKKSAMKVPDDIKKYKIKVSEPSSKVSESAVLPKQKSENNSTSPKVGTFLEPSSSKTGFAVKSSPENEWGKKLPTVHIERNEQTEKQAQKTFLKSFHAYAEKYQRNEKIQQNKIENAKIKQMNMAANKSQEKMTQITAENNIKQLERKIANLQQHCTIEAKQPERPEKKTQVNNEKPKIITPLYPPGFTVSKIEQGVKRKNDENSKMQDKRPSLEITLINPPTTSPVQVNPKPQEKVPIKRPPPPTIPLEKIKKSVNLKSGISIIPKMPERCDNIGALDLSKPGKSPENSPRSSPKIEKTNGFTITPSRQLNALSRPNEKNMGLSNLQMLSKVATEHSSLNNKPAQFNNIMMSPRPQMPNLHSLKSPMQNNMKTPNLQKMPKLNEIQKFRPTNAQIRNNRPNQNQNIRNIPNPSLLIRQNQNRLNSQITIHPTSPADSASNRSTSNVSSTANSPSVSKETTISAVKNILESKMQEKKEISV
ncbi:hypothetical protein JTB14_031183 [Gonioctena quinquepunctata]|nr:hypothetical protein JTB14_031183 [Gonioctena quinquepunctata]